jgi:hypothetical protein
MLKSGLLVVSWCFPYWDKLLATLCQRVGLLAMAPPIMGTSTWRQRLGCGRLSLHC